MILRILVPLGLHAGLTRPAAPAWASGDFGCDASWKLAKTVYSDCDSVPFLSPGNDSRVNLQLQLVDAGQAQIGPAPPKTDPADNADRRQRLAVRPAGLPRRHDRSEAARLTRRMPTTAPTITPAARAAVAAATTTARPRPSTTR